MPPFFDWVMPMTILEMISAGGIALTVFALLITKRASLLITLAMLLDVFQ